MMKKNYLVVIAFLCTGFLSIGQQANTTDQRHPTQVLYPIEFYISEPARDMPADMGPSILEGKIIPRNGMYTSADLSDKRQQKLSYLNSAGESPTSVDPLLQKRQEPLHYPQNRAPITSFEDTDYTASPPDPSMSVGPNHIVTMGNLKWSVYDKSGNIAPGFPKNLNNPLQAPGSTANAGDPVVMYDREADRWFISQFQLPGSNVFLIGISTTPDPTGSYYVYRYNLTAGNDYPHYGVWGNSYVTAGNFSSTTKTFTFNRAKMLAGDPTAEIAGFTLPGIATGGFAAPIPVHSEAQGAATGPIKIVYYQDNAFTGITSDHIGLWNINMDWNNIAGSTVSAKNQIPTAAFDAIIAGGFANIAQPGTAQRIDAIVGAVMNMSHWYKFATHESILLNWVVETVNGSQISGIRWVELRSTNGGASWSVYQEGTFTDPTGSESVFMGCIAMDKNGNIGLGYTKSGTTTFPSLYYTGRKAGDPLGIMTVAEQLAIAGTSSVTVNDRYGDYGQAVRDPSDDLTFWVTSEYSGNARNVRVYSYKIDQEFEFENDVAVTAIIQPNTSATLGASQIISVSVQNLGSNTVTNVPIQYTINGGTPVTATIAGPISPLQIITYTFATTANLSAVGTYTICVKTSLVGDQQPSNDSLCKNVVHLSCIPVTLTGCNVDGIKRFILGTINVDDGGIGCNTESTSGEVGYANRTNLSTNLDRTAGNNTHILQAQTGYNPEQLKVWIDFNNNGIFEATEELLNQPFTSVDALNNFNLVIPTNAALGPHIMRCRAFDSEANPITIGPCDNIAYGETQDYTVNIVNIDASGCTGTSTFAGTSWNTVPTLTASAIIGSNYNTATRGNINACSLTVNSGVTLTIGPDDYVNIQNNIINNGTIIVQSLYDTPNTRVKQGSIIQVNSAVTPVNNGIININVTTPPLNGLDFMVLGNPMTTETTSGVFASTFRVRKHTTSLFTPNAAVAATNPNAGNWVDEEGDDWSLHNGLLNPTEGYMVIQSNITTGTPISYNMTYTNGTVHNGNYSYTAGYNGNQNASPNIMANPYPSAIDAEKFILTNSAIVDAVYFWEHKIAASAGTPGPYGLDYSMDDISIFNLTGGTASSISNPSTVPNGAIATAQGFGIKAKAAGNVNFTNAMRLRTGNNTLREPDNKDRLWISLKNNTYTSLNSTALIGFMEGTTVGFDSGYDAIRNAASISIYSHPENLEEGLSIQSRGIFNVDMEIPMGFASQIDQPNTYTISLVNIEGINLSNVLVFLEDRQTGAITNLSEQDYEFGSGNGIFNNRFTLKFENKVLGTNTSALEIISMYPNPAQDKIYINSAYAEVNAVKIFDIQGRVVFSKTTISNKNAVQIDISKINAAVYFVEITTDAGQIVKRLIKN